MPDRHHRYLSELPPDRDSDAGACNTQTRGDTDASTRNADPGSGNADAGSDRHGNAGAGAAPRHQSLVDLRRGRASGRGQVDG
ncbi:hypothetical protein CARN8_4290002 [mine drainage metagenome]|uniref:Uncharacterized protein n=1 Tax=mine drainage metagenome TaxID=410659 RepID=A0A3P3ZPN5_9ZZZZ